MNYRFVEFDDKLKRRYINVSYIVHISSIDSEGEKWEAVLSTGEKLQMTRDQAVNLLTSVQSKDESIE